MRLQNGPQARIAIVIDNATWHNRLTEESVPPKRAWRKAVLQLWLTNHGIPFDADYTKAELLELAFQNLPPKKYLTDVAAAEFNIEIVRLPIKHCVLNPIELCWSQLKSYVRQNNTQFRLTDITTLSQEYIAALDDCTAFIAHAHKAEMTFRQADNYVEEAIDPEIVDSDEEQEEEEAQFSMDSSSEDDSS